MQQQLTKWLNDKIGILSAFFQLFIASLRLKKYVRYANDRDAMKHHWLNTHTHGFSLINKNEKDKKKREQRAGDDGAETKRMKLNEIQILEGERMSERAATAAVEKNLLEKEEDDDGWQRQQRQLFKQIDIDLVISVNYSFK